MTTVLKINGEVDEAPWPFIFGFSWVGLRAKADPKYEREEMLSSLLSKAHGSLHSQLREQNVQLEEHLDANLTQYSNKLTD